VLVSSSARDELLSELRRAAFGSNEFASRVLRLCKLSQEPTAAVSAIAVEQYTGVRKDERHPGFAIDCRDDAPVFLVSRVSNAYGYQLPQFQRMPSP
jgi:hypothetical protein